ncbi:orotidine 5'-phosphate decarboxylase / HUMPS family protein, partial [Arthrobacter sp. EpRS71]
MKLQVAIDLLTTEAALELAGQVAEYVDIIELGTPLIKAEGL